MIDKVLVAAALIQTALTTLRAGSRAYHMFRTGSIGTMEGPLILPPQRVNESALLWELSVAFRHAVMLEARPEMYEMEYVETILVDRNENERNDCEYDSSAITSDAYRMSTYGTDRQQMEKDELDAYIEELLLDDGESDKNTSRTVGNSFELDGLLDVVTSSGKDTDKDNYDHSSLTRIGNEVAEDLNKLKQESSGMLSRLRQALVGRWRRADRDWDETSDVDMDDDVESATSFHTKVEIASELSVPKKASVYAYAPEVFRDLRRFFGVSEFEYLHSVLQSGPFVSFQSNSKGAARVGGVFFFTRDGSYLIKTIKRDEVGAFLKILMRYHKFMKRNGRRSLLTRFCGMYEVELPVDGGKTRHETFVVMNSVFPVEAAKFITERFDLKGSTLGRECSLEERKSKGTNAVLKDLDLARENSLLRSLRQNKGPKVPIGLHIGRSAKSAFMNQLRRDVKLLADCQLIDYSLLVGVVVETARPPSMQDLVVSSFAEGMDGRKQTNLFKKILNPIKVLLTPPMFLAKTAFVSAKRSATWPMPYYGSELCGVETGRLSHIHGERLGRKALYYFGLIDFLQPFNWKKEIEWKWKALRYGEGFSCVPPDEYAQRFLNFIEDHIT